MGWRIAVFLVCVVGIVVTSYWAIEAIKAVSERFRISETFLGSVFLSVGTSFPEFTNSIYAGIKDRSSPGLPMESIKSFYNITGANVWQILFLSLAMVGLALYGKGKGCIRRRVIYRNGHIFFGELFGTGEQDMDQIVKIFWKDSTLSWCLTWLETLALIIIFLVPGPFGQLTIGGERGFSPLTLVFLIIWVGYTAKTYREQPQSGNSNRARHFLGLSRPSLVITTLSLWLLFGLFSCTNFYILGTFDLDPSTSFGVVLSFVTSSPEFCVMYFLFRQKEYRIAVSGFFGSSLFNLSLPFYSNIISWNNVFGRNMSSLQDQQFQPLKIIVWLMLNSVAITMFLALFNRNKRHREKIMVADGLAILASYVAVSWALSIH